MDKQAKSNALVFAAGASCAVGALGLGIWLGSRLAEKGSRVPETRADRAEPRQSVGIAGSSSSTQTPPRTMRQAATSDVKRGFRGGATSPMMRGFGMRGVFEDGGLSRLLLGAPATGGVSAGRISADDELGASETLGKGVLEEDAAAEGVVRKGSVDLPVLAHDRSASAPEVIRSSKSLQSKLEEAVAGNPHCVRPIIIVVGGASGSGKTSIAMELQKHLPHHKVESISQDSYYRSLPEGTDASSYNFDHPDAIDFDLIVQQLKDLAKGKDVEVPNYDFATHKRLAGTRLVSKPSVVILDGIFTLSIPSVRRNCDLTVFTLEDLDICLARRLRRDLQERGRDVDSVLKQYHRFVKPGYHTFIAPSMREADLIIPRSRENKRAIQMLARDIATQVRHLERKFRRAVGGSGGDDGSVGSLEHRPSSGKYGPGALGTEPAGGGAPPQGGELESLLVRSSRAASEGGASGEGGEVAGDEEAVGIDLEAETPRLDTAQRPQRKVSDPLDVSDIG